MFKILVVGNLDTGEFFDNVSWIESQNYETLLPDFIGAITPDTIGVWADETGKLYKDAGKWYRFMIRRTTKQIASIVSVIARMTKQTCILIQTNKGYSLVYQNADIVYLGKSAQIVDRGLFDADRLSSLSNATYDIRLSKYWIVAA